MLPPRNITIALITLLSAANASSSLAQHLRHHSSPPRSGNVCPPCPPYELTDPHKVFPPIAPPSTRDEPAPAPSLDSDRSQQPSQQSETPQQPQQPQAPPTAPPTFTPPSQPTTAATSPLSSAPNMIGDFFGNSTTFQVQTPGIAQFSPNAVKNTPLPFYVGSMTTPGGHLILPNVFLDFTGAGGPGVITFDLTSIHTETDINTANPSTFGLAWTDNEGQDYFDLGAVTSTAFPYIDPTTNMIAPGYRFLVAGTAVLDEDNNSPGTGNLTVVNGDSVVTKDNGDGTFTFGDEDGFRVIIDAVDVPVLSVEVPVGALAGRIKLAENSSPMPRDRIILDYSYFDQIALAPGGVNVNRITPGFEKTFWNGIASFEVRTPFATTLDSDIGNVNTIGPFNTREVEFGNVMTNLKFLLYRKDNVALSTGMAMAFPTADDTTVALSNGVKSFRVNNDALHLMPFIGGLWAPSSRFFAQGILQFDVGTNGNEVLANLNPNDLGFVDYTGPVTLTGPSGLREIGELDDPTFLYADLSLGYWLYQNSCADSCITGIAGLFELHYNTTLEGFDSVRADIPNTGFTFIDPMTMDTTVVAPTQFEINGPKEFNQLNVLVGATVELKKNTVVQLGYGLPIAEDKVFDGEFRLNFNHYFGRSARRTALTRAGSL